MKIKTIEWKENKIRIINQSKLPAKLEYVFIKDIKSLWQAIRSMRLRGAPVLAAAAALGVYLGIKDYPAENFRSFIKQMEKVISYLGSCRPTARNLFWALERMRRVALENKEKPITDLKKLILKEAKRIIQEDRLTCRKIGHYGAGLIKPGNRILTICNAGALATIDYGTALGVIYSAQEKKKKVQVFACETRPMLQGARLTAWELKNKGVEVTLICDNTAASLMKEGKIDKVITGADRIARNGDSANKIGTYNLAVLANYHGIPFYIAAPGTTFDLRIKSGKDIPIEERGKEEVTRLFFKKPIAPKGVRVFNPAFDVTPNQLISAIITEKGIIHPPYEKNILRLFGRYADK